MSSSSWDLKKNFKNAGQCYKQNLEIIIKSGEVLIQTSEDMHQCYMLHVGLQRNMLP